jgi:uncharacterized small protein (DUF1192 family)
MDIEDNLPSPTDDALALLRRQDLDPLSVAELEARIAQLQAELTRTREHAQRAVNHRATADALFKR